VQLGAMAHGNSYIVTLGVRHCVTLGVRPCDLFSISVENKKQGLAPFLNCERAGN
jgi:hypothetical protein